MNRINDYIPLNPTPKIKTLLNNDKTLLSTAKGRHTCDKYCPNTVAYLEGIFRTLAKQSYYDKDIITYYLIKCNTKSSFYFEHLHPSAYNL